MLLDDLENGIKCLFFSFIPRIFVSVLSTQTDEVASLMFTFTEMQLALLQVTPYCVKQ